MSFHVLTDLSIYTLDTNTSTHVAGVDKATFERVETTNDLMDNQRFVKITIGTAITILSLADLARMTTLLLQGQG